MQQLPDRRTDDQWLNEEGEGVEYIVKSVEQSMDLSVEFIVELIVDSRVEQIAQGV